MIMHMTPMEIPGMEEKNQAQAILLLYTTYFLVGFEAEI